ncbi:hypothetical protein ElyMa_005838200 [Elysia marginata]|uniref:SoHo domain-containing protein n=1 Tax=Elysia marginata TaxID=1093978 RepID=A0AAV4FXI7_9GAST|nr:hypothetical protein ElyMa_005838200 [Elysia marginata]
MPISQNPKECGWFYHAPAKKTITEKVDYPAPSNIPGIGFDEPGSLEPEQVKEMMFRETDSQYIRLAKMGGRKDLLAFTPERYRAKQQETGYPRNEWYYLEDNRIEDEEKKAQEEKEWEFLLPEYMVHKAYRPSFEDPSTPTRSAAPYHTEKHSIMDQGKSATDKTVKIPEVRRPGYGVRNQKPPLAQQKMPPREKAFKPKESEHFESRNGQKMTMPTEREDPTSMMKLLSGEYEREWYTKLAEQGKQGSRGSERSRVRSAKGSGVPQAQKSAGDFRTEPHNASQRVKPQPEEKEMFKMARFKNIPSKLDTHQRPEIMASVK